VDERLHFAHGKTAWFASVSQPLHLHVADRRATVVVNQSARWVHDDATGMALQSAAQVLQLDVSDPASIVLRDQYDVPGRVLDSRLVDGVLYLSSVQPGACVGCDESKVHDYNRDDDFERAPLEHP